MDLFYWIDKIKAQAIAGGLILGLLASSVRGLSSKDSPRTFLIRMYCGGVVASFVAYLLSDSPFELPKIAYGVVVWFCGWFGAEAGALLAKGGKKKMEDALGIEDEKDKEDGNDIKPDA